MLTQKHKGLNLSIPLKLYLVFFISLVLAQPAWAAKYDISFIKGDNLNSINGSTTKAESAIAFYVEPNKEVALYGWTVYDTNACTTIDTGAWTITSRPTHGSVRFATAPATAETGPCAGQTLIYNFAYYTWTSASNKGGLDNFALNWSASSSDPPYDYSFSSKWQAILLTVNFKEHGTTYGWDDFTDPENPYKSVGTGSTDTVKAATLPAKFRSKISFNSSNPSSVTVSPTTPTSANQTLTFSGGSAGLATIEAKTDTNLTVRQMSGVAYNSKAKTVSVTLINKAGTDKTDRGYKSKNINDASIKSMLTKVYKQAVISFTVTRQPTLNVAFDLNKDNKLDVESWMSPEMELIRDAAQNDAYDYNIFLVSHPTDGSCGFMNFNQKYGFIHADTCGNSRTVAHELGHGQGLEHTPDDEMDIMYNFSSNKKWRLRKAQWDTLNP